MFAVILPSFVAFIISLLSAKARFSHPDIKPKKIRKTKKTKNLRNNQTPFKHPSSHETGGGIIFMAYGASNVISMPVTGVPADTLITSAEFLSALLLYHL